MSARNIHAFGLVLVATAYAYASGGGPAHASQDTPTGQEDSTSPRIVLEALDGTTSIRTAGMEPLTSLGKAGAAFARFEGVQTGAPAASDPPLVDFASLELAGGDRLTAAVIGGDGDTLRVQLRGGVQLDLMIDVVRSIVFAGRIPASTTQSPVAGDDGDRLYLVANRGVDRATGLVDSFGATSLSFEDARLGVRDYDWSKVVALFITPLDGLEEPLPASESSDGPKSPDGTKGPERISVSLSGGGRLTGKLVRILGPTKGLILSLGAGEGAEVRLPGAIVREVSLDDGSFRFLSQVARVPEAPESLFGDEIGFRWPTRADRNCSGGPLKVAGIVYDRGLGVHAPSKLQWKGLAKAGWTELRLACGVDDTAAPKSDGAPTGTVQFRVLGDGKLLWESEVLRAGEAAVQPPPISLIDSDSSEGIDELTLEVDPAGEFVLDRANWLRPMLVR